MSEGAVVENIVEIMTDLEHEASGINLKGAKAIVRSIFDSENPDEPRELMVEWTADTLKKFPDVFFLASYDQEINWSIYILPENVVAVVEGTFSNYEQDWTKQEIFTRCFLSELGREGKTIASVFTKAVNPEKVSPLDCWHRFLSENLRFPIKCFVCYPYEEGDGPVKESEQLILKGLNGIDRSMGIFADVECNGKSYILPLMDIAPVEEISKNARYLNAYGLWLMCVA